MAGPLDIQRLPLGLVDLLGMKGSGDTPHTLSESIVLTLSDGVDYYTSVRRQILTGDTAIALAAGGFFAAVGLTPAAGEIWLVYNVTCTVDVATAAATAVRLHGALQRQSLDVQLSDPISLGATDLDSRSRSFERPLVAIPGDQFGVRCSTVTGAPGCKGRIRLDVAKLLI